MNEYNDELAEKLAPVLANYMESPAEMDHLDAAYDALNCVEPLIRADERVKALAAIIASDPDGDVLDDGTIAVIRSVLGGAS